MERLADTDAALLENYSKEGIERAFRSLVKRHLPLVLGVAQRITSDAHLAEDVSQEVFVRLAQDPPKLGTHAPLGPWLHTVTRARAIDALRKRKRRQAFEARDTHQLPMTSPPSQEPEWSELEPVLDDALHRLSDSDREVVLLRFFHEYSHVEVGKVLGISANTARMRVTRALERLRDEMAGRGVATSTAFLALHLPSQAMASVPVGFASSISAGAIASVGTASASASLSSLLCKSFLLMNTKSVATIVTTATLTCLVTTAVVRQGSSPTNTSTQHQAGNRPVPSLERKGRAEKTVGRLSGDPAQAAPNADAQFHELDDYQQRMDKWKKKRIERSLSKIIQHLDLDTEGAQRLVQAFPIDSLEQINSSGDFRSQLAEILSESEMREYDGLVEKAIDGGAEHIAFTSFATYNRMIPGLSETQRGKILSHFFEQYRAELDDEDPLFGSYGSVLDDSWFQGHRPPDPLDIEGKVYALDAHREAREASPFLLNPATSWTEPLNSRFPDFVW